MNVAAFDAAWSARWPAPDRRSMLAAGTWLAADLEYAVTPRQRAELLRRHRAALDALSSSSHLIVATCSWSASAVPTPRDEAVAAVLPDAVHWHSADLALEPGFSSWEHRFVSRVSRTGPELDELLLLVADDLTDGVLVTAEVPEWVYLPTERDVRVTARGRLAERLPEIVGGLA